MAIMGRLSAYLKRGLHYVISGQPIHEVRANITYLSPSGSLKGKKVFITGGGRGLGKAMARKFVGEGAEVVIAGRNEETLRSAAIEIGCKWIQFDVTDFNRHEETIHRVKDMMNGLDVLVNNAGISLHEGCSANVSMEQFDAQVNCNLKGCYFLTQQFVKQTNEESNRSVLFVSSERGFFSDDLPYGLTKAAVNSLVKGLAYRYVQKHIRVNAVAPGVTSSDMTGVAMDGNLYYPCNTDNRAYLPEEVAEVASFLISDAAGCLSGQILCCNEAKSVNPMIR